MYKFVPNPGKAKEIYTFFLAFLNIFIVESPDFLKFKFELYYKINIECIS